jgi:hypothetical protein
MEVGVRIWMGLLLPILLLLLHAVLLVLLVGLLQTVALMLLELGLLQWLRLLRLLLLRHCGICFVFVPNRVWVGLRVTGASSGGA